MAVEKDPGKPRLVPVIGVVNAGTIVEVWSETTTDSREVALDLNIEHVDVIKIQELRASEHPDFKHIEGAEEFFIQVPELSLHQSRTSLSLRQREWTLVGSFPGHWRMKAAVPPALSSLRENVFTLILVRAETRRKAE